MDAANLRSVPLFASLDSKATAELGEYLTIHDYPRSATIFRNGDPGDAMYLIDVGRVRISITDADGATVTLAELGAGDFFGDMAMLDDLRRSGRGPYRRIWRQLEIYHLFNCAVWGLGGGQHDSADAKTVRSLSVHPVESGAEHDYGVAGADHHDVAKSAVA